MKNLKPRRTNDSYNAMYVLEHPAKMFLKGFSNGLHNCPFKVFWNLFFFAYYENQASDWFWTPSSIHWLANSKTWNSTL